MEETNVHEVRDAEVVDTPTVSPVEEKPVQTKKLFVALAIVVIGLIASGGVYFFLKERANTVAVINGTKITLEEFQGNVDMITENAKLQGVDVTNSETEKQIKAQALDMLVNNALLIAGARAAGMTADEEEIKTQYDAIVSGVGGEEELKKKMEEIGLTEEKLRSNIADRIMADAYIEAQTDIETLTVTDEEITSFYDSVSKDAAGSEIPKLSDIKPQIEAQLLSPKQTALVANFIKTLRDEATVDIRLEELK